MAKITKITSPKPPITPPMIDPRFLGPFVVLKDALEVPLVEIPLIALKVSDDELIGVKTVECPEDKLEDDRASELAD
jgi:hypothetical protein